MASSPTRKRIVPERERNYLSKCSSLKTGFPTKREALDHAEDLMELGRVKPGCHLTPYLCDECHDWHVYNRTIVFPQLV